MSKESSPVLDLEDLPPEELDRLPFGVIKVDEAGVIRAYNAAESQLSGLRPESVLGRNFFTEVAPCTGMPSFYTRFINGMERGPFSFSLSYTFNFATSPMRVRIVVERPSRRKHAWIQVHQVATLEDPIAEAIREIVHSGQREALDAAACADEPIRTPGTIQAHGALLAFDRETGALTTWSANIGEFIEEESVVGGARLADLFPPLEAKLRSLLLSTMPEGVAFYETFSRGDDAIDVRLHRAGESILVELEYALRESSSPQLLFDSQRCRDELDRCSSVGELASIAARWARSISGLDRALVYRFLSDGSGLAIGEERANTRFPPLVGLHFPESDIPSQARALYLHSTLRHTPDNDFQAVPLVSAADEAPAFDLGFAELRSPSPFHRAYHRNMGVAASFSVSVRVEGALWGLLIGHHAQPRHLSATIRRALAQLARDVEYNLLRLKGVESREPREHFDLRQVLARRALEEDPSPAGLLLDASPGLGDLFEASGIAVFEGESLRGRGVLPSRAALLQIRAHLGKLDAPIFMTRRLAAELPELAAETSAAGVLGLRLGPDADLCVLWLRREEPDEVAWGGAPSKESIAIGERRVLLPRRSFERWIETRRGIARAWPDWTEEAARDLREVLLTASAYHARATRERGILQWQLNRARTTYLSTMSHELRTPLNAILGIIETTDIDAVPPGLRADLLLVQDAAKDLGLVIDDVLDYARLEVGDSRDQLRYESTDLAGVVRRTVELMRPRAEAQGLRIRTADEGLPYVQTDGRRVAQVLGQLLLNAIKYTDEGTIEVTCDLDGGRARVEVIDTGVGFDEAEVDALFAAFSRAGLRTHNAHRPGSGLGLAISRALVTAMGGELGARSNPGGGSTFWFELPMKLADATPPASAVTSDERYATVPRPDKLTILLAEDNEVNRMIMRRMLDEPGWTVVEAATGKEAVHLARARPFDVLVLDLHMPGGDGPEVLAALREGDGPSASAPALLITANVDAAELDEPEFEQFAAILIKPVTTDTLCDAVARAFVESKAGAS